MTTKTRQVVLTTIELEAELEKVRQWLCAMPNQDRIVQVLALSLIHVRGAHSPETAIPDEELEFCVRQFEELMLDLQLVSLLAGKKVVCNVVDGEMMWSSVKDGQPIDEVLNHE